MSRLFRFVALAALFAALLVALRPDVTTAAAAEAADVTLCQGCAPDTSTCAPGKAIALSSGKCVERNGTVYRGETFVSFMVNSNIATPDEFALLLFRDTCDKDMVIVARCRTRSCCALEEGHDVTIDGVAYAAFAVTSTGQATASPTKSPSRGDIDSDHFPWWATMLTVIGGLGLLLTIAAIICFILYWRKRNQYQAL
jgi:hypothetical protein